MPNPLPPLFAVVLVIGCTDATTSAPTDPRATEPTPSTVTVPPTGPVVSEVVLQRGEGAQIRQGGGRVTLEVTGERLDGATLDLDLPVDIVGNTDTQITFRSWAAIDTALGFRDLGVRTPEGETWLAGALEVVPITVAPEGDDLAPGTPDAPFRTITHALAEAEPGQVVTLLPGTYSAATGETFPLLVQDRQLEGAGSALTHLVGDADPMGIFLFGTTRIEGFRISGMDSGIRALDAHHEIVDVTSVGHNWQGLGVVFQDVAGTVTVEDCTFSDNGAEGIVTYSEPTGSTLTVVRTEATGNDVGLGASLNADVSIVGSTLNGNRIGLDVSAWSTTEVRDGVVNDNTEDGIVGSDAAALTLTNAEVSSNGGSGVDFGGLEITIRESDVIDNVRDGVRITHQARADLGTVRDPGNNRFGSSGTTFSSGDRLADDRDEGVVPSILAVGVDLDMATGPTGLEIGAAEDPPFWRILHDGNRIDFGL